MSRPLSTFIACLLSAFIISGCGGQTDDDATEASEGTSTSDSSASPEPASPEAAEFDPATATLSDAPFCGEVDLTAAESALGIGGSQLELVSERVAGKKYKSPLGGESTVAKSNSCSYADSGQTAFFSVAVGPDGSAKDTQASLDAMAAYVGKDGQSDKCAVKDESAYGDPGGVLLCTGVAYSMKGRAQVSVISLVGGSSFFCSASIAKGSTPEQLEQPVRDLCAEVLKQRAAG